MLVMVKTLLLISFALCVSLSASANNGRFLDQDSKYIGKFYSYGESYKSYNEDSSDDYYGSAFKSYNSVKNNHGYERDRRPTEYIQRKRQIAPTPVIPKVIPPKKQIINPYPFDNDKEYYPLVYHE